MGFAALRDIDDLSVLSSTIHKRDPRAKIIVSIVYLGVVVSYGKYALSALIPFAVYPLFLIVLADIPVKHLLKQLLIVSLFAVLVGIWNPILDRQEMLRIGNLGISGGWISFFSIVLRFFLTASAALILIATTGISDICQGLQRMKIPRIFVTQILFLHRYIFVLAEEVFRLDRARAARTFGSKGMDFNTYSRMLGALLLRSLDRAQRVYVAMKSRGFDGVVRPLGRLEWQLADTCYLLMWCVFFIFLRVVNISRLLGEFIAGGVI